MLSAAGTLTEAYDADRSAAKADLASELAEIEVQKGGQEGGRSRRRRERLIAALKGASVARIINPAGDGSGGDKSDEGGGDEEDFGEHF